MPSRRTLKLAAIGTGAGLFSGLFGVGGGAVLVPLLIIWLGLGARAAAGTSLAAIAIIASVAAATHSAYGSLHVDDALLVGLPAVGGVVVGTALQQRVPQRALALAFAGLLLAVAVDLIVA